MISHAANARKPTSVAISCGYAVWPGSTCPPPPKQPQSIVRPRAHDCATAAMNPTSTTADTTAVIRVAAPSSTSSPNTISTNGNAVATMPTRPSGRIS